MDIKKVGLPELPDGYRWRMTNGQICHFLNIEKKGLIFWKSVARCSVEAMMFQRSTEDKIRMASWHCINDFEIKMYEGVIE